MRSRRGWLWDDWNIDHISQHGVAPFEAEEVGNHPRYVERWRDRYLAWGSTAEGRFLLVVYVHRREGRYVISARGMSQAEKRRVRRLSGR